MSATPPVLPSWDAPIGYLPGTTNCPIPAGARLEIKNVNYGQVYSALLLVTPDGKNYTLNVRAGEVVRLTIDQTESVNAVGGDTGWVYVVVPRDQPFNALDSTPRYVTTDTGTGG